MATALLAQLAGDSAQPLLWAGGMDAIGLLGLAASCCAGNDGLAGVHELIVATEIFHVLPMIVPVGDTRRIHGLKFVPVSTTSLPPEPDPDDGLRSVSVGAGVT